MYLILFLGLVAFIASLGLTPLVRDFFLRRNIVDKPDQFRKLHNKPIPRVGGIAIAVAYAGACALAAVLPLEGLAPLGLAMPGVWKLCLPAGLVFLTGLVDDLIGLDPKWKLTEQIVAAGMAALGPVLRRITRDKGAASTR